MFQLPLRGFSHPTTGTRPCWRLPPPHRLVWAKLSAEKRQREGDAGSVQTGLPAQQGEEEALDTAAMLSSYVKTQPPILESGSVSKCRHELKKLTSK